MFYYIENKKDYSNRKYITSDFFIQKSSSMTKSKVKKTEDCRKNIKEVICLVDPTPEGEDSLQRKCQDGSQGYAKYFEDLHDNYPPVLQKVFCSLDVIFVEKKFFGTAYAGLIQDENGNSTGAQMGIRKSVLDEGLNLKTWASWKEQLSFGGITDDYTISKNLPIIKTKSQITQVSDFLYFVVAHEFGHILDFANKINYTINCEEDETDCEMAEGTWGSIGWETDQRPKAKNNFFRRSDLCFYWCNGSVIAKDDIPALYAELFATDFLSTYATTQPWDDFADSLAYFVMDQNLATTYIIQLDNDDQYDIAK